MRALIFDTETTGLVKNGGQDLSKQPQVIEFYGCIIDNETFEDISELEFLINPGIILPEKIKEITKLNDAMLKDQPPFVELATTIQQFFKQADIAVAHNLHFDRQLINFEYQRLGLKFEWPAKTLCTVEATEHLHGYRLNLAKLYSELFPGETFPGAHRAKADVQALKRCYIEMRKRNLA